MEANMDVATIFKVGGTQPCIIGHWKAKSRRGIPLVLKSGGDASPPVATSLEASKAPRRIVPIEEVMARRHILDENWQLTSLFPVLHTVDETLKWMARRRLLCNEVKCTSCGSLMGLTHRPKSIDGIRWRCRACDVSKSIRDGSFFSRSKLSLQQIVLIIYCWSVDMTQQQIAREVNIASGGRTIVDWCKFCRVECDVWLRKLPNQLGGIDENCQPIIVEIGETNYFHRKYHQDTDRNGYWVFGGIERESGKCFLVEVPDRTANTLLPLLCQFILPGSLIMSNGCSSYDGIEQLNGGIYLHSVVVPKDRFVDPDDASVHNQTIVNL